MDSISYHPFTEQDCLEVLSLWANTPGVHLHDNGEDSLEGILAYLERNPGLSFIAKHAGKIVGAVICGHDGRRGLVHHLAVDLQFRKIGIGKTLLQMCIEQLREVKIKKCLLFVLKDNAEAEAFYRSLRWQEETIVKVYATVI